MIINMQDMMPHADYNRMMSNAKRISIIADGKAYNSEMHLSIDDARHLVIVVGSAKAPPKAKPAKKAKKPYGGIAP